VTEDYRNLHAVELRDEAVRILRRAVEHVQRAELTAGLNTLAFEGQRWWDVAQHTPAVQAFDDRSAA
jgi:hypothetical protein